MPLIDRPRIELLRKLFLGVFLVLIITIISTPLLFGGGFSFVEEETLEALLLLGQVSLAWYIFRLYERTVKRREGEIQKLEAEYQKREKELLETFSYLGKINVQMSLIKDFLKKLKAPTSKKEVKAYLDDVLRMALSISKRDWMMVKIINTQNMQTVSEHCTQLAPEAKDANPAIGNREILEIVKDKEICNEKGYCVLPSSGSKKYREKAFLIFEEKEGVDREVLDFLKAAINQCEVIHALFVLSNQSRYA